MLKTKNVVLEDNGNRLTFVIRQMPALKAWHWCNKVILLLCNAGADIPLENGFSGAVEYIREHGLGVLGKLDYGKAQPLMEELLAQCYRVVDKMETQVTPDSCEAYLEDVRTLYLLEKEAFILSLPFFSGAGASTTQGSPSTVTLKAR